mmetsp:Transcript_3847/g.5293  ORF Transcript_3847/g.5293 Transcript_3847/m.5293 type:complete len:97 (-) Transcript_3847:340-630(-)
MNDMMVDYNNRKFPQQEQSHQSLYTFFALQRAMSKTLVTLKLVVEAISMLPWNSAKLFEWIDLGMNPLAEFCPIDEKYVNLEKDVNLRTLSMLSEL